MLALSLTQPWATLVAMGEKCIETRSWSSRYRGPVAIHAAKGFPGWAQETTLYPPFHQVLRRAGFFAERGAEPALPRGAIIATARLVDCLPIVAAPTGRRPVIAPDDEGLMRVWRPFELEPFGDAGWTGETTTEHEAAFGDYTPGRFGWVLSDVRALAEPIPCRGALRLWTISAELEQAVTEQLAGFNSIEGVPA